MDRPALKMLLADIGDGKVDVVVVYKIDRLTRSLFDFAKIVETFDAQKSLVRVGDTSLQHHHVDGPADAQCVAVGSRAIRTRGHGERIRDKFAASKKRGIGWAAISRLATISSAAAELVVNEVEADAASERFSGYTRSSAPFSKFNANSTG